VHGDKQDRRSKGPAISQEELVAFSLVRSQLHERRLTVSQFFHVCIQLHLSLVNIQANKKHKKKL